MEAAHGYCGWSSEVDEKLEWVCLVGWVALTERKGVDGVRVRSTLATYHLPPPNYTTAERAFGWEMCQKARYTCAFISQSKRAYWAHINMGTFRVRDFMSMKPCSTIEVNTFGNGGKH